MQRLNEGLRRASGVILISASAGFGKTTLVSEWVAALTPGPFFLGVTPATTLALALTPAEPSWIRASTGATAVDVDWPTFGSVHAEYRAQPTPIAISPVDLAQFMARSLRSAGAARVPAPRPLTPHPILSEQGGLSKMLRDVPL